MFNNKLQVIVVGGGAAGFWGAIATAVSHPYTQVTLLEAGSEVLAKVRISGGGRCNVTHACFDPALLAQHYPRGGKALRAAFTRFQPQDTIAWFAQRGVKLKTEADGRMFPVTDDSATIVDCLIRAARQAGVVIRTKAAVTGVTPTEGRFRLQLKSGEKLVCDRILLATGGSPQGHRLAKSLGHTLELPVPSLFTFNVHDPALRQMAGVSVNSTAVKLSVPDAKPLKQTGPLLITHWGLSGPAVLKLSAWGARLLHDHRYQAQLQVNWLPDANPEDVRGQLTSAKTDFPKRGVATYCPFKIPRRLWQYLVQRIGIDEGVLWSGLSKKTLNKLVEELTQGNYPIQGKGVFKEEFVTCGGVKLKDVNFKTMESRLCPGLYFAGEILDIDGVTGGFNFQSAWTTAWLAGQAMGVI
ncbi:MAG: NAD(P)/FAD-dependent oxidoreductase [Leptolyngbyaceae cyanobacterium MO_188.B28]|nr:NAD(P)/FAD-dependent oxidoreductase [Leptolyngbyaceae cyanobacterium MO_188.B28]